MRNFVYLLGVCLFGLNCFAGPQFSSEWKFKRTDGVVGKVSLKGDIVNCVAYPAGKDDNIFVNVGSLAVQAKSCSTDADANYASGTFKVTPEPAIWNIRVDFGKSFVQLMQTFAKLGPAVVGPIGGSVSGTCPSEATAFLTVDGFTLGDPKADLIGYCLFP